MTVMLTAYPAAGYPTPSVVKSAAVNVGADAHVPTYTVAKGVDYAVPDGIAVEDARFGGELR
jgi:hypothetical protein